jgi:hypothetical protein
VRRIVLIVLAVLSLPILLHVYQPAWKLEGWGLMLGMLGMTLSPLILFGSLLYMVGKEWNK